MVPCAASPPATPLTCQLTAELGDPRTLALKVRVAPAASVVADGETLTGDDDAVTVTGTAAMAFEFACATAATVTAAGLGMAEGAV
jgi:hypothetical protein